MQFNVFTNFLCFFFGIRQLLIKKLKKMNDLIVFAMKYQKKNRGHRIDLATLFSKHCDWLEIVPLVVHAGTRMCAL